ncbi:MULTISPECIES: hypothetical protein [Pseudomonas]|uniref:Uncharacterized protein n=1 Tax=Pseudomonas putida TaxID=303 RepID=A0A1X1A601_PSEPU|nr:MULTISPECIES: hypothetical protein [Pseudomonas]MDD1989894.1 hypothetical protein [Pseudomonas putida]ORL67356.1 hypothetical protein B7H17_03310 [Pseudomonas putida]QOH70676.1 hypothetical protein IGB31_24605 [Pseudomonas putida]RFQ01622.1 hypothetical protein D0O09_15030 [Pseudomonas putida]HDS1797068.1 hypothetical protein [Pseudomonas putida]
MNEKLRFKSEPCRPAVTSDELKLFARGAFEDAQNLDQPLSLPQAAIHGKPTETILFRCTKQDFDEITFVFERINVKSRQKLIESVLLPEIRRLAKLLQGLDQG